MRCVVIVNPAAAGGKAAELWPRIEESVRDVFGDHEVRFSTSLDNAGLLARDALRDGALTVLVVGGDGMCSAVANGFIEDGQPVSPDAALALIPAGTGSDLARTLGIPRKPVAAIESLRTARRLPTDLIRCSYTNSDGGQSVRYVLNASQIGFGAVVAGRVNRSSKRVRGTLPYLAIALATLVQWRHIPVTLDLDDRATIRANILEIAVANGQYFGGGMHIAPRASIQDGRLDLVIVPKIGLGRALAFIPPLYRNGILGRNGVIWRQCRKITVRSDDEIKTPIEIDGEDVGCLPATFEVIPQPISVLVPNPACR
ncbi:MAG: diacylglycerol kinase family lipid kinase [Candidatus Hydrogenedentes bacterium]|nr:diacylglycerol kinase family lipid kinase [Candidatus Hydrogenedentota bacterium]